MPARNASPRLPIDISASGRLVEQGRNRTWVRIANRAARLPGPLEGDQRALHSGSERLDRIFLGIEVHVKDHQIAELVLLFEIAQDRRLRLACRTPGRMNLDQNGFSGSLRRCAAVSARASLIG